MKFADVIVLSVILAVFSTVFTNEISALRKLDLLIEQLRTENDSLSFISESFYSTCEGHGFSSLEEWKKVCSSLYPLEAIEWEVFSLGGNAGENLICGSWSGTAGEKRVYYRMNNSKEKSNWSLR